jgi:pyrroloquinoline quinone (PQQ) biosynthesis protein C
VDEITITRSRFAQARWLWLEIGHRREYRDIPRHPFHRRWFGGQLTATDLQAYASEHHHAVVGLASAWRRAASLADGMLAEELTRRADEHERDLDCWCEFAVETGWGRSSAWYYAEDPLPETVACARVWSGGSHRSLPRHLVTLYAIESTQSRLASLQLDALIRHHGFADERGARFFRRRLDAATENAGIVKAALTGHLPDDALALLRQAELACRSYWELLDGVHRLTQSSTVQPASRAHATPPRADVTPPRADATPPRADVTPN